MSIMIKQIRKIADISNADAVPISVLAQQTRDIIHPLFGKTESDKDDPPWVSGKLRIQSRILVLQIS
jgi:hypothetical protein